MDAAADTFDAARVLRAARLCAGLSQAELARRAGTSQAAVSDIERGRSRPTVDRLDRLLRACDHHLQVAGGQPALDVDPHDLQLLKLNVKRTPDQRLARMVQLFRLKGRAVK